MDDNDIATGSVVTVFRSTLRPEAVAEYEIVSEQMVDLARSMPGMVDYKTLAEHDAWRRHPEHRDAQRLGRERFYETYAIQVCTCRGERRFSR
jgi:heme-degrading monooxygenase HmoA